MRDLFLPLEAQPFREARQFLDSQYADIPR